MRTRVVIVGAASQAGSDSSAAPSHIAQPGIGLALE